MSNTFVLNVKTSPLVRDLNGKVDALDAAFAQLRVWQYAKALTEVDASHGHTYAVYNPTPCRPSSC